MLYLVGVFDQGHIQAWSKILVGALSQPDCPSPSGYSLFFIHSSPIPQFSTTPSSSCTPIFYPLHPLCLSLYHFIHSLSLFFIFLSDPHPSSCHSCIHSYSSLFLSTYLFHPPSFPLSIYFYVPSRIWQVQVFSNGNVTPNPYHLKKLLLTRKTADFSSPVFYQWNNLLQIKKLTQLPSLRVTWHFFVETTRPWTFELNTIILSLLRLFCCWIRKRTDPPCPRWN